MTAPGAPGTRGPPGAHAPPSPHRGAAALSKATDGVRGATARGAGGRRAAGGACGRRGLGARPGCRPRCRYRHAHREVGGWRAGAESGSCVRRGGGAAAGVRRRGCCPPRFRRGRRGGAERKGRQGGRVRWIANILLHSTQPQDDQNRIINLAVIERLCCWRPLRYKRT